MIDHLDQNIDKLIRKFHPCFEDGKMELYNLKDDINEKHSLIKNTEKNK